MNERLLSLLPTLELPQRIVCGTRAPAVLEIFAEQSVLAVVSSTWQQAHHNLLATWFGVQVPTIAMHGEPTTDDLARLVAAASASASKRLLAVGGGSVIDVAKLAKRTLSVPMVALPTTLGSGAEVSQHAVLLDGMRKTVTSSPGLMPEMVILDPSQLASLPREHVLLQSLDALAHALEAMVSRRSHPAADAFATSAVGILIPALRALAQKGISPGVLEQLQLGGVFAGIAQSSAATGLAHAAAHVVGPRAGLGHAQSVTLFLRDVLRLNAAHTDKYRKLDGTTRLASATLVGELDELYARLGVPLPRLGALGELSALAESVRKDVCAITNPYVATTDEIQTMIVSHL